MTILEAIVLGVLQGITEFLPVSSSGHLVLMQHFLGIKESKVFFEVMLHFGTLGAVIIVYYQLIGSLVQTGVSTLFQADFYRQPRLTIANTPDLRLIWFLLLGSIPTGLIALLFKDSLEAIFGKPMVVAGMLIITGLILQLSRVGQKWQETGTPLRVWHTPLIGIAQGLAIIPGISRSGSTISISLLLGLSPQVAAQYSFLLSIPAILGAVILKLRDIGEITIAPTVIVAGTLTSFIIGYIALRFLLAMLSRGKFSVFSYYCFALGIVAVVSIWRGA